VNSLIEITMFYSQDEIDREVERLREQERLRGRTLTPDEVVDPRLDITEPEDED
jgi:hypothetical protein